MTIPRSPKAEPHTVEPERPLGVVVFSLFFTLINLLAMLRAIDLLSGTEAAQEMLDAHLRRGGADPFLLLLVGGFGSIAAMRFFALHRDGWALILVAAVVNPVWLTAYGYASPAFAAIPYALIVYLFTPAVKKLYGSNFGPTL